MSFNDLKLKITLGHNGEEIDIEYDGLNFQIIYRNLCIDIEDFELFEIIKNHILEKNLIHEKVQCRFKKIR